MLPIVNHTCLIFRDGKKKKAPFYEQQNLLIQLIVICSGVGELVISDIISSRISIMIALITSDHTHAGCPFTAFLVPNLRPPPFSRLAPALFPVVVSYYFYFRGGRMREVSCPSLRHILTEEDV